MNVRHVRKLKGNTVQMLTTLPTPNLCCFSNEVTLFGWKIPDVRDVLTFRTSHSLYDNNLRFHLRSVLSQTFFFFLLVFTYTLNFQVKNYQLFEFFFFLYHHTSRSFFIVFIPFWTNLFTKTLKKLASRISNPVWLAQSESKIYPDMATTLLLMQLNSH